MFAKIAKMGMGGGKALVVTWSAMALCTPFATLGAGTWHVAKTGSDISGNGSAEAPWLTIQHAVDAPSVKAGDTIKVAPGDYYTEGQKDSSGHNSSLIVKKNVTIESTGSADDTFISGIWSTIDGQCGFGSDARRCVTVENNYYGVVIKGFTLRNGAADYSNGASGYCGGFYYASTTSRGDPGINPTIVDCVISNCVGTRAAGMMGGNAVRCLIVDNISGNKLGNPGGSGFRYSNAFYCIFKGNSNTGFSSGYVFDYPGVIVNCTFSGNSFKTAFGQGAGSPICGVYNSIFVGNTNVSFSSGANLPVSNSVFQVTSTAGAADAGGNVTGAEAAYVYAASDDLTPCAPLIDGVDGLAAATGDAACLALIPEAYRYTDFAGNAVPSTGRIPAGAITATAPNPGGFVSAKDCELDIDGKKCASGEFFHPSVWPTQLCVKVTVPDGSDLYAYSVAGRGGNPGWTVYPTLDDELFVVPIKARGATFISPIYAAQTIYAAPDGNDGNSGEDAEHPMTLQGAVDAATLANTLVRAAAGTYDVGAKTALSISARLVVPDLAMRIVGSGNRESVIVGAPDPDQVSTAWKGCGPGATRCVTVQGSAARCLQNFTFKDGYAHRQDDGGAGADARGAAGGLYFSQNNSSQQVLDSTFTNCHARMGAPFYRGAAFRCEISGCTDYNNSLVQSSILFGCVFRGNTSMYGIVGTACRAFNCTVDANKSVPTTGDGLFRNVVFLNGTTKTGSVVNGGITNCVFGNSAICQYSNCKVMDVADAMLADVGNGDYRPTVLSAALGYGTAAEDFTQYATCDMYGNRMRFDGGAPICGALFGVVPAVNIVSSDGSQANLLIDGGGWGVTVLEGDRTEMVVASDGTRKLEGFVISGTTQAVQQVTLDAATCGTVTAVWGRDYYVSPDGDDSRNGFTPLTAKKTLAAALAVRWTNDVVHAAAGTYDDNTMLQDVFYHVNAESPYIRARAVVPDHVTLVADEGPSATVIRGASASSPDTYGNGSDAVRCVALGHNAVIDGFTLDGGRVMSSTDRTNTDNYNGGGVITYPVGDSLGCGTVRNCTITNCVGIRGGAGCGGRYVHCRILGNKAVVYVPAVRVASLYGCYVDHNRGENTMQDVYAVVDTTIGKDNRRLDGTNPTYPIVPNVNAATPNVVNSVVFGSRCQAAVFAVNTLFESCQHVTDRIAQMTNCVVASASEMLVGDDGRISSPSSPAVGLADNARSSALTEGRDLDGIQRIFNATQDAGAYEFDYRPVYRQILGRGFTVEAASSATVGAGNEVLLPENGTLSVSWPADRLGGRGLIHVRVTGNGTLQATLNDEPLGTWTSATAGELLEMPFAFDSLANVLAFGYTAGVGDTGGAFLSQFRNDSGMLILIK